MRALEFMLFMRHYFPIFVAGIFAALFSVVIASVLVLDAFFKDVQPDTSWKWLFAVLTVLTVLISLFNVLIIWGRADGILGLVSVLITCLILVFPTIEHRPHKFTYVLGVLLPVLGLFVLNTARHRELRKILVIVRRKRERLLGIRRARILRLRASQRK